MNERREIVLLGSANQDVVVRVERIPSPGETVLAIGRAEYAGGKGLNQGIAAARSGAATTFLGALGNDSAGSMLATVMVEAGIDVQHLRRVDEATGQAFITVDKEGENSIVVSSGANATVSSLTEQEREVIASADLLLMQYELPMSVVTEAAAHAKEHGVRVLVNSAPALETSKELLALIDVLIVNEHESMVLGGGGDEFASALRLAKLVPHLVMTLGSKGCVLYSDGVELARLAAHKVQVVDTTGAGDTFCGAFAAELSRGADLVSAAVFASGASALAIQTAGAVPSIPKREAVDAFLLSVGDSARAHQE